MLEAQLAAIGPKYLWMKVRSRGRSGPTLRPSPMPAPHPERKVGVPSVEGPIRVWDRTFKSLVRSGEVARVDLLRPDAGQIDDTATRDVDQRVAVLVRANCVGLAAQRDPIALLLVEALDQVAAGNSGRSGRGPPQGRPRACRHRCRQPACRCPARRRARRCLAAEQDIRALVAVDEVVALVAVDDVGPRFPASTSLPLIAEQAVVALAAEGAIIALPAVERVGVLVAVDQVGVEVAVDQVTALAPTERKSRCRLRRRAGRCLRRR